MISCNCSVRHRPQGVFDAERVKNTGVRQRDRARMAWSVHRRMPFVTVKHVVLNSYDLRIIRLRNADNRTRTCTVSQQNLNLPRLPITPYPQMWAGKHVSSPVPFNNYSNYS